MKVGPIDLPVTSAKQLLGFAVLVIGIIYVSRILPVPAAVKKYMP